MTQQTMPTKGKTIKTRRQNEEKDYFKKKIINSETSKSITTGSIILDGSENNQQSASSFMPGSLILRKKRNKTINELKSTNMEKEKRKNYKKKTSLDKSLEKSLKNSKKLNSKKKKFKAKSINNTKTFNSIFKNEMSKSYKKNKLKSKTMKNIINNGESFNAGESIHIGSNENGIEIRHFLENGKSSTEDKTIEGVNCSFEKKKEANIQEPNLETSSSGNLNSSRKDCKFQYYKVCTLHDNSLPKNNAKTLSMEYALVQKLLESDSKNDTEPENAVLKLKKYATLRKELSSLNEKSSESLTKNNEYFTLKNKKNLTDLEKESLISERFSNGDIKNVNKERRGNSLIKKSTHKKNKLLKSDEKESTSFKGKYLSESKNKIKKYNTTKVKGKLFKSKIKRSIEYHTDTGMHSSRSLYNKHVYITDNVQVVEMRSERCSARGGKKRDTIYELKGISLEKQKKDICEESEKTSLKNTRSLKSMESSKSMGSVKSVRKVDEKKEELTGRGKGKNEQYINGMEEKKDTNGIKDYKIENGNEKEGKMKEHKEYADYKNIYFSYLGSGDCLEMEKKSDTCVEVDPMKKQIDPMKKQVDAILNKYLNYKRKIHKNQKKKSFLKSKNIMEPIQIKEESFKMDTIKFMSNVKENTYYDDILFFFDNYELKQKKHENILKLFNRLFKSERFELDGIRSLLLIYDRIFKKLQKNIETYPLKTIFSDAVKEAEKRCEEERMKIKNLKLQALYNKEKIKDGLIILDRFLAIDEKGNTRSISSGLSLINASDNLVEVKIKKLKNNPCAHENILDNLCTQNSNSERFIPLLLRKHWHDQRKLCILKKKLDEMKKRKTPQFLQITDVKKDTRKCCPFNFLNLCIGHSDDQNNISKYDVQYISLPNTYPQDLYANSNLQLPCCYTSKRQSYKISDVIQFLPS